MAEHRFRSPDGNEWVAINTPSEEVLASYPAGTIEIPLVDPAPPTLDQVKSALKSSIDSAAEIERRKYITSGSGQAMTYMQKADEARRYLAAAAKGEEPVAVDYPLLSAEIGITAPTLGDVAVVVNEAFTQWQQIGAAIEATRLGAKAAIDAATSIEEAQTASSVVWPAP